MIILLIPMVVRRRRRTAPCSCTSVLRGQPIAPSMNVTWPNGNEKPRREAMEEVWVVRVPSIGMISLWWKRLSLMSTRSWRRYHRQHRYVWQFLRRSSFRWGKKRMIRLRSKRRKWRNRRPRMIMWIWMMRTTTKRRKVVKNSRWCPITNQR